MDLPWLRPAAPYSATATLFGAIGTPEATTKAAVVVLQNQGKERDSRFLLFQPPAIALQPLLRRT